MTFVEKEPQAKQENDFSRLLKRRFKDAQYLRPITGQEVEYRSELFTEDTVPKLIDHLQTSGVTMENLNTAVDSFMLKTALNAKDILTNEPSSRRSLLRFCSVVDFWHGMRTALITIAENKHPDKNYDLKRQVLNTINWHNLPYSFDFINKWLEDGVKAALKILSDVYSPTNKSHS